MCQLGGFWHFSWGFLNFWSDAPKFRSVGGEGMCIIVEICEKRLLQKFTG